MIDLDFVYIALPWAVGMGEPYAVARIMDFVTRSEDGTDTQIRANIFLRMRDLTHRANNDSRLLVATMHAELYPIKAIRGKCRVKHRDLISDGSPQELAAWKRRDDHFYYHQLYDRYIHRFYDVIPTYKVKNAPEAVLDTLREKYSFIVAEVGISSDLCDALRGCTVCREWAPSAESVRCDTCRKYFHMRCVNPPLLSKPAKGYSWSCAPCTRQHDAHVEEHGVGGGGLNSDVTLPVRGPRSQAASSRRANRAHFFGDVPAQTNEASLHTSMDREGLRCYQGWPYRYFGEYTSARDVLDSHDSIYPRAVTRCGAKYQMSVASWDEQNEPKLEASSRTEYDAVPEADSLSPSKSTSRNKRRGSAKKIRRGTHSAQGAMEVDEPESVPVKKDVIHSRGGDETVKCIYKTSTTLSPDVVDEYLQTVTAPRSQIPRYSVDFMDRALELLCDNDYNTGAAAQQFGASQDKDFNYFQLTSKESESIDKTLRENSADMSLLKRALPERTPGEIVKSIYSWQT